MPGSWPGRTHWYSFIPRWTIDAGIWWQYMFPLAAVALLVVLWLARRRIGRGPLTAALIFGGVLVPALGFFNVFPFRYSFVADHYQYHASIALITLGAAAMTTLVASYARHTRWILPLTAVVVLVPLTVLAHQKAYVYRDDFTLHTDVVRLYPGSWVARNNIAAILIREEEYDEARSWLEDAIRLFPDEPVPRGNLGWVLSEMGRYDEAQAALELAMKSPADQGEKAWLLRLVAELETKQNRLDEALEHVNASLQWQQDWTTFVLRGRVRAMRGDTAGALTDLNRVLQYQPDSFEGLEARARILASSGRFRQALDDLQKLSLQAPDSANVQVQIAGVQQAARRPKEALAAFGRALALDPENAMARVGRGDLYFSLGQLASATGDYEHVLHSKPANVAAQNNLAWLLSTAPDAQFRDGQRAVELAAAACQATEYRRADVLSTLAAAYAEAGDFAAAVQWSQKAIELAAPEQKSQLSEQLAAYRRHQPWRENGSNRPRL